MHFKEFILKNKKIAASVAIGLFLGTSFGINSTVSKDEYIVHNQEKNTIISQLEEKKETLNSTEEQLTILLSKESNLKKQKEEVLEKQRLAKEEAERKAKEEAEAIARAKAEEDRLVKEAERLAQEEAERVAANNNYNNTYTETVNESEPIGQMVYKTATGKKYHSHNNCGNTNSSNTSYITLEQAQNLGLTACSKCY